MATTRVGLSGPMAAYPGFAPKAASSEAKPSSLTLLGVG